MFTLARDKLGQIFGKNGQNRYEDEKMVTTDRKMAREPAELGREADRAHPGG
jgi:hypothetical protein